MNMSEQTNEIFAALSKAQGGMDMPSKSKTGHGYKYADLAECIATAQRHLKENGLAVTQLMGNIDKEATLITVLTHSSGQYISSEFIMEKAILSGGAAKNPAQAMGASITYMRRYAYAAILGLAQEDDDAANVRKQNREQDEIASVRAMVAACADEMALKDLWQSLPQETQNIPQVKRAFNARKAELAQPATEAMTDPQRKAIMAHYKGWDREKRLADLSSFFQAEIDSTNQLTKSMASEFIDAINSNTNSEEAA